MKKISLCSTHQREQRTTVPQGCPTCRRINIERDIVLRTVARLLAAGYALATDAENSDSERFYGPVTPTRDAEPLTAQLMETDEEYLGVFRSEEATGETRIVQPFGWVRFVYGNDGWDVIADYTVNLEDVLKPVFDYVDQTYA
jgi:hypothetical protein